MPYFNTTSPFVRMHPTLVFMKTITMTRDLIHYTSEQPATRPVGINTRHPPPPHTNMYMLHKQRLENTLDEKGGHGQVCTFSLKTNATGSLPFAQLEGILHLERLRASRCTQEIARGPCTSSWGLLLGSTQCPALSSVKSTHKQKLQYSAYHSRATLPKSSPHTMYSPEEGHQ